ncbi:PREDICTED: translational activator of cytochrome c oxidase 1 isoform X2 [Cyphomyrmex costatus]|uniref:translational activator of cytochrome c oxidase 1 isoform X2 n=1 Tax=Cyphomyrmex costatus TaxID=456900 RepID=UPI00085225CB|nr:PREDICTED: translational activator of cytochrome c oxidase 1 isoform X2 [Cyphomyrmex costatus]
MSRLLNRLLFDRLIYLLPKSGKRFAGHSKWQNIKHIKEENDNKRMVQFYSLKLQMKVAILGGTTNPNNNLKLSKIIERAKKVNMPVASIKSFLDKMETRKNKTQAGVIEVRGPSGYTMVVSYMTDNPKAFLIEFNSKLKKTKGKATDSFAKNMFIHIGSIKVEKKGNLEQAMEDAINIGAEDVEEFKENDMECFQFKCDPKFLNKIKCLLEDLQYYVLSIEEDYISPTVIELNESDLEAVSLIHKKILSLEDVTKIHDNLA